MKLKEPQTVGPGRPRAVQTQARRQAAEAQRIERANRRRLRRMVMISA